jgi:hypothetical protein
MILPDGALCCHLETVGNPDGVDALVQQVLGLLQQSPAQHHHPRRPVSDFIVLKQKKARCSTISASVAVFESEDDGKQSGSGIRN